MGKQKQQRRRLHTATKPKPDHPEKAAGEALNNPCPILQPSENVFKDVSIDIGHVKTRLNEDTVSMKSYKSTKSDAGGSNHTSKKDKLKQRKEILLRRIDTVNQLKKETKLRKKRQNTALIGDTNALHDALPSLDSLLKSKKMTGVRNVAKPKGIQKAEKRKKELTAGVHMYKKLLKLEIYKKDPKSTISEHIKRIIPESAKC